MWRLVLVALVGLAAIVPGDAAHVCSSTTNYTLLTSLSDTSTDYDPGTVLTEHYFTVSPAVLTIGMPFYVTQPRQLVAVQIKFTESNACGGANANNLTVWNTTSRTVLAIVPFTPVAGSSNAPTPSTIRWTTIEITPPLFFDAGQNFTLSYKLHGCSTERIYTFTPSNNTLDQTHGVYASGRPVYASIAVYTVTAGGFPFYPLPDTDTWILLTPVFQACNYSATSLFQRTLPPPGYTTGLINAGKGEYGNVFDVATDPVWVTKLSVQGNTSINGYTLRLWNFTSGVLLRQAWTPSTSGNWIDVVLDRPIQLTPGSRYAVTTVFAATSPAYFKYQGVTAQFVNTVQDSLITTPLYTNVHLAGIVFTGATTNTTTDTAPSLATTNNKPTFLVDVAYQLTSPLNATTTGTANPVFNAQTLRVGKVTYGPSVCGVTHTCTSALPGVWVGVQGQCRAYNDNSTGVNATVDFTCGLVDPTNPFCFSSSQCSCVNPCLTGPMCTQARVPIAATGNNPHLCYADNPILQSAALQPCGLFPGNACPIGTRCRRQTFTGTKTIQVSGVTTVITASDVCCDRGWSGDFCDVPVGCTLHGCDNGGTCVLVNSTRQQDSYCDGCRQGVADVNGTLISAGFYGQFCEKSKSDGQSWRRVTHVNITNIVGGRRLLSTTVSAPTAVVGSPVYRCCDCGGGWSLAGTGVLNTLGSLPYTLLYSGNIGRSPLTAPLNSLLHPVGFNPLDTTHQQTLQRAVGSVAEAKYLCDIDYACAGVFYFGNHALFFATPFTSLGVTGPTNLVTAYGSSSGSLYLINRRARRVRCADDTLDAVYYYNLYQTNITATLVGKTVGNLDIPLGTSPTILAQIHFRMFGHLLHFRPNAACDFSLDVSEDVLYCNYTIPVEAQIDTNFTSITTRTDTITALTTEVCVANTTLVDTTNTTIASQFVTTDATGTVVEGTYNVTTSYLTQNNTNITCSTTGLVPPVVVVNTTTTNTVVDLHSIDLTTTCAPVALVNSSRFFTPLPTPGVVNQTGTITYVQATPTCACSVPFRDSSGNQSDCADTRCGAFGYVNTSWFESPSLRLQDACVCVAPFETTVCTDVDCQWCQQSTCVTANGGLADPSTGGCSCPVIATGTLCETVLCNATGTYPFNYTFPLGRDTVDPLTGQVLRPENFFCECRGNYHGTYCNVSCVNGYFDPIQQQCICNTRTGFTGDDCSIPLCPGNGQGDWFAGSNTTLVNDTTLSDAQVGGCVCNAPWTGPTCEQHTCDSNPLQYQTDWAGLRPFGAPAKYNTSESSFAWYCACNFPYAGTFNASGPPLDCNEYNCGYGSPSSNITATGTSPIELCQCDTNNQLAIYTDPTECTDASFSACPKPCSVGWCRVDVNVFGGQPIGGPRDAPCCHCSAVLGYNQNSSCTAYCSFYQPCLTTNTSGYTINNPAVYNATQNTYTCGCNANYFSLNATSNDCSLYVPPPVQVFDPSNPPVEPEGVTPESSSSSSTIGGLSKPAFYGLVGTAGFLAVLGVASFYTSTAAEGITTIKSVASIASNIMPSSSATAGRVRLQEKQSLLGKRTTRSTTARTGLFLVCVLVIITLVHATTPRAIGYPDTARWNVANGPLYVDSTLVGNRKATYFDVNAMGGPDVMHRSWVCGIGDAPGLPGAIVSSNQKGPNWHIGLDFGVATPVSTEWVCAFQQGATTFPSDVKLGEVIIRSTPTGLPITWTHTVVSSSLPANSNDGTITFSNGNTYYTFTGVNLCSSTFTCQNGGKCVGRAATSLTDPTLQPADDLYGFNKPTTGAEYWQEPGVGQSLGDTEISTWNNNIRGCSCNGTHFYGLQCELACPTATSAADSSPLCSYRGTCASNLGTTQFTTSTVDVDAGTEEPCVCTTGCVCDSGYTGIRCDQAIPTQNIPSVTDWRACCAWDSPDCAPIQSIVYDTSNVNYQIYPGQAPPPENTTGEVTCNPKLRGDCVDPMYKRRLAVPKVCGEIDDPLFNQIGSGNSAHINVYQLADGSFQRTGRGQCWNDPIQTNQATCWCNTDGLNVPTVSTDAALLTPSQAYRLPRRGWWGTKCEKRTCTEQTLYVWIDATAAAAYGFNGASAIQTNVLTTNGLLQCSGNWAPTLTDGGADPYNQSTICNDKLVRDPPITGPPTNLNTPGVCAQCAQGWGGTTGFSTQKLVGTYGLGSNGNGLCHLRTYHNSAGAECGGYGTPTVEVVQVAIDPFEGTSKNIRRVLSCACPAGPTPTGQGGPWTKSYLSTQYTLAGGQGSQVDTGICQRTCAGSFVPTQVVASFDPTTGQPSSTFATQLFNAGCGGPSRGLCRPIDTGVGLSDGFNSACMCNAGWNGYDCNTVDARFFDPGAPGTGGSAVPPCGAYGTPVLAPLPVGATTTFRDYEYFKAHIAPLQGNDLGSTTAYTAYQCECNAVGLNKSYAVDITRGKWTCSRTCASLHGCSGHGTCIDDPYGLTIDKVCRCQRGWGGQDCSVFILHDAQGAECGGADRGVITYADTYRLTQHCSCLPGYSIHPVHGTCMLDCPQAPSPVSPFALTKCTDPKYGSCTENTVTHNDQQCTCSDGYGGVDCSLTSAPPVQGQSQTLYTCTGRGTQDSAGGYCVCAPGYTGLACELDVSGRDCGTGTPYRDNAAVGVILQAATTFTTPTTANITAPVRHGLFDGIRFLMAHPTVADAGQDPFTAWSSNTSQPLWVKTGATGVFDYVGYYGAYYTLGGLHNTTQSTLQDYIQRGYAAGRDAFVL